MKKIVVLGVASVLALSAVFVSYKVAQTQDTQGSVQAESFWARETAPNAKVAAAYGTFKNATDKDMVITSMTSDVAEKVELHDMVMDNDVMTMRRIETPVIPANGELVLEPKAKHIMLMGMKQDLKPEASFSILLGFEDGSSLVSDVKVNPIGWKKD